MIKRNDTKTLLFLSLNELSKTKPISKITVEEITSNCGLKRGIFYYYYKNKEDLVLSSIHDEFSRILDSYHGKESWEDIIKRNLHFCKDNQPVMDALKKQKALYYGELSDFMLTYIDRIVKNYYGKNELPSLILLSIKLYADGITGVYRDWIGNSCIEPIESIACAVDYCMPECLRDALDKHPPKQK